MNVVLAISGVMLAVAAFLLVMRITVGPTILDRSMALDVLMSVLVCAVAIDAAWGNDTDGLPLLLVVAMVGFAGSVAVARYASRSDDDAAELEDVSRRGAERGAGDDR
jgi:multicomponent Na+:H+ antiporter subunit F